MDDPAEAEPSMAAISPATASARDGTALALVRLPFVFTQDDLLSTEKFIKEAELRGHRLSLETLSGLHDLGILKPLFRIGDSAVFGRKIDVAYRGEMNLRGRLFDAAVEGRLRDVTTEGRTIWEPYQLPADRQERRWWNGFLYSSWQLLEVGHALSEFEFHRRGWRSPSVRTVSDRAQPRILALCALASRHLPSIRGSYSIPAGYDDQAFQRSRFDIDDRDRLALVGFDPTELRGHAEQLLAEARASDPMIEWLPLLRHANHKAWSKLRGAPRDAHEKRVAAEVLLRAHDELVHDGLLEPLPELGPQGWRVPLHDRLSARGPSADSLERALGTFGLSPHPRVLLLVEGQTEMVHLPRLLAEFGLDRPDRVRVQNARGSKANPDLLARYAVSPRIGPAWGGHQFLDATPTALIVAMDAENKWATEADRTIQRRKLQDAIRQEVHRQGADITDKDLDFLVRIFVWGEHSYEFANFTDSELADALAALATEHGIQEATTTSFRQRAEAELATARANHDDVGVAIGKMRLKASKPRLAELLWPAILHEIERAESGHGAHRPVHDLVRLTVDLVSQLSGSGYTLDQPSPASDR